MVASGAPTGNYGAYAQPNNGGVDFYPSSQNDTMNKSENVTDLDSEILINKNSITN